MSRPQDPVPPQDWYVLVEETTGTGRDAMRWELTTIRSFHRYEDAVPYARELARTYQPRHPASPRNRRTFRIGQDCWVIYIEGLMRTFHFRVSVAVAEDFV
jgi:hypothetical protein